jgi:hypothetical protein
MDNSTIQIPNDVIKPIIEAKVAAAVIEALGGYKPMVELAVAQVLNQTVGEDGKPSNYNAVPFFKWAMDDCIKRATRASIEEYFKTHADLIKQAVTVELSKKNSPLVKQLVAALTGTVLNANELRYRMNVTVTTP